MTIIGLLRMSDTSWEEEPSKVLFNGMPVSRSVDPPSFDSKYKFSIVNITYFINVTYSIIHMTYSIINITCSIINLT